MDRCWIVNKRSSAKLVIRRGCGTTTIGWKWVLVGHEALEGSSM